MRQQIEAIISAVHNLGSWHQACFIVACAQRVAPVFTQLAGSQSANIYHEAMRQAWKMLASRQAASAHQIHSLLQGLPEGDAEDSLDASYYAMIAAYPLTIAFGMLGNGVQTDAVGSVCFSNINLCAEISGVSDLRFIAHDQEITGSSLEQDEIVAQVSVLHVLQNEPELSPTVCEQVHTDAIARVQRIEIAALQFARDRGWDSQR